MTRAVTEGTELFRDAIGVILKIGGPILILCMVVGIVTALFQAVTQVHENSVSFVLKVAVVIIFMMLGGSWMMRTLTEFTKSLFDMM